MRTFQVICVAVCASLVISCTHDEQLDEISHKQITMIASDFHYVPESRTSIDITEGGGEFLWEADDVVGIFPNEGSQVAFPMIKGAGTKTASFNGGGWALKPSSEYMAYYPFNKDYMSFRQIPISYANQTQVGNASTGHLGKYDYMRAIATTPESQHVMFNFLHVGCLVELNLMLPAAGELSSVCLVADHPVFTTKGNMDLSSPSALLLYAQKSKFMEVTTKSIRATGTVPVKVYLMLYPDDFTNQKIKLRVQLNDKYYYSQLAMGNLLAGKAYRYTARFTTDKPSEMVYNVATAGTLSQLIGESDKYNIASLKVTGQLNATDIRFIREMAGSDAQLNQTAGILSSLDLSEAQILHGGDYYLNTGTYVYKTEDNTFNDYIFSNCLSLEKVVVPKDVTAIKNAAFKGCQHLKEVSLPACLTFLGGDVFSNCIRLSQLDIPDKVSFMGSRIFDQCEQLSSVKLPASITNLKYRAFHNCVSLTGVMIPESVNYIENNAFEGCENLISINLPENITAIEDRVFAYCGKLESLQLPQRLVSIGSSAFSHCSSLKYINLPQSLTFIDYNAFGWCWNLSTITLPPHIAMIGDLAFYDCHKLKTIFLSEGNRTLPADRLLSAVYCEELHLPSTLEKIEDYALPTNLKRIYCSAVNPPMLSASSGMASSCTIYVPKGAVEKYKTSESWSVYAANIFPVP